MELTRISLGAVLALGITVSAVGPSRAADTVRVGYLGPQTGIFAAAGKDMLDGLKLAFEQLGYQTAGRTTALRPARPLAHHQRSAVAPRA